jgi:hypothetical protein
VALALDEAGQRPLPRLRAGQEGLELGLHDAVEDTRLGAAAVVLLLVVAALRAVAMGSRRCRGAHLDDGLPASYRASSVPRALAGANTIEAEAIRSRSCGRRTSALPHVAVVVVHRLFAVK